MSPSLLLMASLALAAPPRPNVLFLVSDDMRPQLGCYGDRTVKSPHLDRLAARGTVFTQAYCQQALCSPSRISLLSGRHVWSTGIYDIGPTLRSKLPNVVTLPELFKQQGYFTRSLGKVFHIGIDDPQSWSVPSWVSKVPRYGPVGVAAVGKRRAEYDRLGQEPPQKGQGALYFAGPVFEAPDVADDALSDGDIANEALRALENLAGKPQPFFLAVGFLNPHVPWVAPKKYFDLYDAAQLRLPDNRYPPKDAPAFAATSGADFFWYATAPKDRNVTPEFGRQCLQAYFAAISYVDACVGRVLDKLDRLGLAQNTIIVFWGDHGYYMGEHNWWGAKHNTYEGATRAPLLVAAPGQKTRGARAAALVEFVDIFPSLAELAGLPLPSGLEGQSFVPLLHNPQQPWNKVAFSEYPKGGNQGVAMRTDRYRYVEWTDKSGKLVAQELYDHQTDPQENQNLAPTADRALLERLAAQMRTARKANKP